LLMDGEALTHLLLRVGSDPIERMTFH
jgi:hypothetical protein